MKAPGHLLSALPFVLTGHYPAAIGCLLPDLVWIPNEIAFRRSSWASWKNWVIYQPDWTFIPYRLCHSLFAPTLVYLISPGAALGWAIHLLLDIPTHRGRMAAMPLYPITRWQWPERWTLWSNT